MAPTSDAHKEFQQSDLAGALDQLQREAGLIGDRLRTMTDARLARASPPAGMSVADAAHAAAVALSRLADSLNAIGDMRGLSDPPRLADLASGDQFAVLSRSLIDTARAADPASALSAVGEAYAVLAALRERL